MSRGFAIRWLVVSILWFMLSAANAAPSALQQISKTAKAAVVSFIAAATIAASPLLANDESKNPDKFLWLGSPISNLRLPPLLKELSIAGSTDKQVIFGSKLILLRNRDKRYEPSDISLGIFEGKLSGNNDGIRFPRLSAHFIHGDIIIGDEWNTLDDGVFKLLGYDYLDFSTDSLDNHVEGFVAQHLHAIGFEFPMISTSIGVGSISDKINTSNFKQADLDAWAGKDADFSYLFFHEGSLGFTWMPLRKNGPLIRGNSVAMRHSTDGRWYRTDRSVLEIEEEREYVRLGPNGDPGDLVVDFYVKQARTIGGDIDFLDRPDYMDGTFTAIWEELSLQAAQRLWGNSLTDDHQISIIAKLRLYRQRINAEDEAGNSFSSRQDGRKALVKLEMLFR